MNNGTPNSPQELFDLQKKSCDHSDPLGFADFLSEVVLPEEDPTPYQTVKAIEMMLFRLSNYHFDILHDEEADLTPYQRKVWGHDYKRLEKALKHIRLMNPD